MGFSTLIIPKTELTTNDWLPGRMSMTVMLSQEFLPNLSTVFEQQVSNKSSHTLDKNKFCIFIIFESFAFQSCVSIDTCTSSILVKSMLQTDQHQPRNYCHHDDLHVKYQDDVDQPR